MAHIYRLNV